MAQKADPSQTLSIVVLLRQLLDYKEWVLENRARAEDYREEKGMH